MSFPSLVEFGLLDFNNEWCVFEILLDVKCEQKIQLAWLHDSSKRRLT